MKSEVKFGKWESIALLVNFMMTQIILSFPRSMMETAGNAGWMIPIYVTAIILVWFIIISKLYTPFEGNDILDIAEAAGGPVLRVITGLLFIAYIISIVSLILREFAEDMKVIALTTSPISFVTMFFLVGMVVAAYAGIEAIARCHSYMVPVIIGGLIIILLGVAPQFDLYNITPVLGTGIPDIIGKGFFKISIFSSLSLLFFIAPYIQTKKTFKAVGYSSICLAGFLFAATALSYILVFPYPVVLERFLPVYQLARLINYGRFFQRVESIFVLIWATSALLQLSGGFFFILHILRKSFKLLYYKPLIFPMAILLFTISLIPPNVTSAIMLENVFVRNYLWILTFVFPVLLLFIAGRVKKHRNKGGIGKCGD